MPQFYDAKGKAVNVPDGTAAQAMYEQGQAFPIKGQKVPMVVPGGDVREFDAENLDQAIKAGARIASDDEYHKAQLRAKYGNTGEGLAFAAGAARGLSAGLSDAAVIEGTRIFGGEEAAENRRKTLRDIKDLHPVISGAGELAGTAVGMFIGTGEEAAAAKLAEGAAAAGEGVRAAEGAASIKGLLGAGKGVIREGSGLTDEALRLGEGARALARAESGELAAPRATDLATIGHRAKPVDIPTPLQDFEGYAATAANDNGRARALLGEHRTLDDQLHDFSGWYPSNDNFVANDNGVMRMLGEERAAGALPPRPITEPLPGYPVNDNFVANDNAIGIPALGEAPSPRMLGPAPGLPLSNGTIHAPPSSIPATRLLGMGEPAAAEEAARGPLLLGEGERAAVAPPMPPGGNTFVTPGEVIGQRPGAVAPGGPFFAPGSLPHVVTPVRAIDMFGGAIEHAAKNVLGNGFAAKVVARAARGAGEMGAFEVGNEISEAELNDTPLVGEQTLAHLGHAAVLGGILGTGSALFGHALESLSPALRKAAAEQRFRSLSPKQKYIKQADKFVKGDEGGLTGWRYVGDVLNRKNIGGTVEEMREALAKEVPLSGEKLDKLYSAVDAQIRPIDLYKTLTRMADEKAKTWGGEAAVNTLRTYRDSMARVTGMIDADGALLPTAADKAMSFADAVQQRMRLDDLIYSETNPLAESAKAKVLREFRHKFDDHIMSVAEEAEKKAENAVTRRQMVEAKKEYQALRLAKKAIDDTAATINAGRTFHLSDNIWGASAAGGITGMMHNPLGIPMGFAVAAGHKYLRENGSDLAAKTFYKLADVGAVKEASNIASQNTKKAVGNVFGEYRSRPKFKTYKSRDERDARFETTVLAVTNAAARRNDIVDALAQTQGPTVNTPQVHASLSAATLRGVDLLAAHIPDGHNGTNTLQPGLDKRAVSDADKAKWLRLYDAVDRPIDTLEDGLKQGTITKDQVDAISTVYPTLYANFKDQVMDKVAEKTVKGKKLTYQQKIHLNTVLGVQPDTSFSPAFISDMQKVYVANADRHGKAGRPPTPGVNAKPLQGFSLELATDYDKREFSKPR